MASPKRILLYSQHLSGTGHYVRTYEIARTLADGHEVYLVDGGRTIPRSEPDVPFSQIVLPRIYRSGEGIAPVDSTRNIEGIMRERRETLSGAAQRIRPDVVLIEHFPFSKWELYPEIVSLIEHARGVNSLARVICSLRDIAPRTQNDPAPEQYHRDVLRTLHTYFNGIFVHADPAITRMQEYIPWVDEIALPIEYTGYVSEKPGSRPLQLGAMLPGNTGKRGVVIVSTGGAGSKMLIAQCIAAWKHPHLQGVVNNGVLVIFVPLFVQNEDLEFFDQQISGEHVFLMPFTSNFIDWMNAAELSISEAGYNTCTNILETRTRAILIPDARMSDQPLRARRIAGMGLASVIDPDELGSNRLASAIADTLSRPAPRHDIDLNGAQRTREILEAV